MKTAKGVELPTALADALSQAPLLAEVFERMRPSCQREYAGWVQEAVGPETVQRRVARVLEEVRVWGERHPVARSARRSKGVG